jgi:hypothetical protein
MSTYEQYRRNRENRLRNSNQGDCICNGVDQPNVEGYPDVVIVNSTQFRAFGRVEYLSAFCRNDDYSVSPAPGTWSNSRGVCLITRITATVVTPSGNIAATPYESSGTSYSQFAIIQTGPNQFEVTRRVT